MVILPTGSGKSLIYQFYALLNNGLVLVITPLVSLMNDQLQKMPKYIRAGCLNSMQSN